jgi:hypothetical protein
MVGRKSTPQVGTSAASFSHSSHPFKAMNEFGGWGGVRVMQSEGLKGGEGEEQVKVKNGVG